MGGDKKNGVGIHCWHVFSFYAWLSLYTVARILGMAFEGWVAVFILFP